MTMHVFIFQVITIFSRAITWLFCVETLPSPCKSRSMCRLNFLLSEPVHVFTIFQLLTFFMCVFLSECPANYTCMPNTGPNPISEYISYDNFGWSLLTSLQLVTMDYWESIYNSVSRVLVNFVTSDTSHTYIHPYSEYEAMPSTKF